MITSIAQSNKMWAREWIPYCFISISGAGIVANLTSCNFIRTTFNTKDNLFNILVKDSLITALGLTLQFVTELLMILNPEWLQNELGCVISHYGGFLATFIGPLVTVLISSRRFIQIKYPHLIKINSVAFNTFTTTILSIFAIYHLLFNIIDVYG